MAVVAPRSLFGRMSRPPAGTYDPGLDAQLRAAQRGFGDVQQDIDISGQRANTNYTIDRGVAARDLGRSSATIHRERGRGLEDFGFQEQGVNRQYGRSLADLLRDRTRAGEDRSTSLANIQRGYQRQGRAQGEAAARGNVTGGGTLGAALAKRQENEQLDRQPVETSYNRFLADSRTGEGRLGEDRGVDLGRIGTLRNRFMEDSQRADQELYDNYNDPTIGRFAQIDTGYARGVDDRALDLSRAGRENTFYGQDIADQRNYQASQMGWVPPPQQTPQSLTPAQRRMRLPGAFSPSWMR